MATPCTVMVQQRGKVNAIYVHQDGYPMGVGRGLFEHFNSQKLAEALISNGNRRHVREEVAKAVFSTKDSSGTLLIDEALLRRLEVESHQSFCKKIGQKFDLDRFNWCFGDSTIYDEPAREYDTYEDGIQDWNHDVVHYYYLWDGAQWHVNNFKLATVLERIDANWEKESPETPPENRSDSKFYESWQERALSS